MPDTTAAFIQHDHSACQSKALAYVTEQCAAKGLRLTEARRRVLEILLESHTALGAYDVLQRLNTEGYSAQPPIAYRALDFLVEHGFAHKVERISAFVACHFPGQCHAPAFLICRSCRTVAESRSARQVNPLQADAQAMKFSIEDTNVEAEGLCQSCQSEQGA